MQRERNASLAMFGCNTYGYILSQRAEVCLARLADYGFQEFELMVHPGHLWPAELSPEKRSEIRRLLDQRDLRLTTINLPNIDINIASTTPEMRAYSLDLLGATVRLAGELGVRGVVISPGKASPLFAAAPEVLQGYFFAALDRLCPVAAASGTALWIENVPFAFEPAVSSLMYLLGRYGNDAVRVVYDIANAYFIGEDFTAGLRTCQTRLALVHLSDTSRKVYRHDRVGDGTLPFDEVPAALAAVGYHGRPMLEIISRNPDQDIVASANVLAAHGLGHSNELPSLQRG
jgi:L-ribulose-5-phosphate 3-epimerase